MDKKEEACLTEKGCQDNGNGASNNDKLIYNFLDVHHTMRSLYEGRGSQKHILIVLLETGSITQSKLTERLGIRPGSASEVLAKLERAGLIVRTGSPNDRRTTDVALTEQGKSLAQEAAAQRRKRHEEMFSCLTEEEKRTLLALLEKISIDWRERYQSVGDRIGGGHEHCRGKAEGSNDGHSCGGRGSRRHHHENGGR